MDEHVGSHCAVWTDDGREISGTLRSVSDDSVAVECLAEDGSITLWTVQRYHVAALGVVTRGAQSKAATA